MIGNMKTFEVLYWCISKKFLSPTIWGFGNVPILVLCPYIHTTSHFLSKVVWLIFFWAQIINFLFCDLRHWSLMGLGGGLVFHWWERLLISQHLTPWICIFPTSLNSSHNVPAMDFVTSFVFLFVYIAKKSKQSKVKVCWSGMRCWQIPHSLAGKNAVFSKGIIVLWMAALKIFAQQHKSILEYLRVKPLPFGTIICKIICIIMTCLCNCCNANYTPCYSFAINCWLKCLSIILVLFVY